MDRGPFAEPFRDITPGRARSEYPNDSTDAGPVVKVWPPMTDLRMQQWAESLPLIVSNFFTAQQQILLAMGEHVPLAYTP
ncbi:hypothetical protein GCM10008955_41440 [Deinococcus malanensis]|uniref:Uncharacterized protein n=1 Tax=Deinococcus malanensis TaxID=1706855 RepID=A0ABQ2F604_9DEIO|nr:hypothetical protein GCM10008955_41440 [Deinococcus malanensis]